MKILSEFWDAIGKWFSDLFNNIGLFFTSSEASFSTSEKIVVSIFLILIAWLLMLLIKKGYRATKNKGPQLDVSARSFLFELFKILYWVVIAFLVINVLDINVSSLAGVISAVTVALGLALQDIISMVASGILMIHTKNFKTGDYIAINNGFGKVEGSVHRITLLYTLLTTPDGQEVIVPNNNVTKANLVNYTRNPLRRMNIIVPIEYSQEVDPVRKIILGILENDQYVCKDPAPKIFVDSFGESSINVNVRCHIPMNHYWDVVLDLREKILIEFKKNGISIPFNRLVISKDEKSKDNDLEEID